MPSDMTTSLAAEIRAQMARKNLGVQDLADALGVHRVTASRLRSGHVPLDIDQLERVCTFLELDPAVVLAIGEHGQVSA